MKEKVLNLIAACMNTKNLSDRQLNEEFQKMWDEILKQFSLTALPSYEVGKEHTDSYIATWKQKVELYVRCF